MNGPEHYAKAEDLLDRAGNVILDITQLIAFAQVHATLALAPAQTVEAADPVEAGFAERQRIRNFAIDLSNELRTRPFASARSWADALEWFADRMKGHICDAASDVEKLWGRRSETSS